MLNLFFTNLKTIEKIAIIRLVINVATTLLKISLKFKVTPHFRGNYTKILIKSKGDENMEKEILAEIKKTNELLQQQIKQKDEQYELLTVEQVHEEYGIGTNMVRKMFNDPELPVQRYTVPFKVNRQALNEYMTKSHDYLCERS